MKNLTSHTFYCLFIFFFLFGYHQMASAQDGKISLETTTDSPDAKSVYANSIPLAYGTVRSDGFIDTEYGVASVTKTSTGIYEIELQNGFFGHAVVNTTVRFGGVVGSSITNTYESDAATKTVTCYFANVTTAADQAFSFVIYGTPLNTDNDCPPLSSNTGFAQAPNDNLHFNFTNGSDCMTAIPFAILDPTPNVQVVVGNFVSPPATDPVEVTINHDFDNGVMSQSINLTSAGATLNLGTYVSAANLVPYSIDLILTYDGSQFVTAQVVATPL